MATPDEVDAEITTEAGGVVEDLPEEEAPTTAVTIVRPEDFSEEQQLAIEAAIMDNNYGKLSVSERLYLMKRKCDALGVDMLQSPYVWGLVDKKKRPIPTKNLSEQLRAKHGISLRILEEVFDEKLAIYKVTVAGVNQYGRIDTDTGVVGIQNQKGAALADSIMTAITKAKNRVTNSLAGGVGAPSEGETHVQGGIDPATLKGQLAGQEGARRVDPSALLGAISHAGMTKVPAQPAQPQLPAAPAGPPEPGERWTAAVAAVEAEEAATEAPPTPPAPRPVPPAPRGPVAPPPSARPSGALPKAAKAPQLGNPPKTQATQNPPAVASAPPRKPPIKAQKRG